MFTYMLALCIVQQLKHHYGNGGSLEAGLQSVYNKIGKNIFDY